MLRRHGSFALVCLALTALPGMVHAQPVTSVIDVPCPFGIYGVEAHSSSASYDVSALVGALLAIDYTTPYNECLAVLPAENPADAMDPTGILKGKVAALDKQMQAVSDLDKVIPTLDPFSKLTRLATEALVALEAADFNDACGAFESSLELIKLTAQVPPPVVVSPARTLGDNLAAVSVSFSPAVYDSQDGQRVAAADRIDSNLYWVAAAYGLTDRLDLRLNVPFYRLDVPPGSTPSGTFSGVGDVVVGALWNFGKWNDALTVLSLDASVQLDTGDEAELLGTGDVIYRAGVSGDHMFGDGPVDVTVFGSLWGLSRDGDGEGYGARAGVDVPLLPNMGVFVGAIGEDDAADRFFADAFAGIRVGAPVAQDDGVSDRRIDGRITYHWPLTDDGFRPDGWLLVTGQLTW